MGSTFNSFPAAFQENFVKRAFEGFNGFDSKSLKDALSVNETANYRVTAVTFETRPDWASKKQVEELIRLGATRIELGVQSLDESVLEKVKRGHGTEEVREATRNCRDAFLKICYHMMPGLYSTPKKDAKMFEELFKNKDYRPDALKIYPCLVVQGTKLYDEWLEGRFEPYDEEKAAEALALAKKFVPKYCRIMRVERDIPTNLIAAGVKKSNLREIAWKRAKELGIGCGCIRCRELGFRKKIEGEEPELNRLNYDANEGGELFLSFDYPKSGALAGYLRLRVTENAFLPELKTESTCAGVRELKVVGEQVRIGEKEERGRESAQHKGLGKKLMAEAERIAREEFDCRKLFVISGVGAREYYRKLGYGVEGSFVSKRLA
jgi:elongator complex protein 3